MPLAGSDVEQQRINPDKVATAAASTIPKVSVTKDSREPRPTGSLPAVAAANTSAVAAPGRTTGAQGDQKAETTKVSLKLPGISGRLDVMQIDIVRPALSAAVIALLTRKETVDAVQSPFELLADDVGDGVSVSTMVTALTDANSTGGRRKGPANQAAYTSVWIKGERLQAKPGRADDFTWPRPGSELEGTTLPNQAAGAPNSGKPTAPAVRATNEAATSTTKGADKTPRTQRPSQQR